MLHALNWMLCIMGLEKLSTDITTITVTIDLKFDNSITVGHGTMVDDDGEFEGLRQHHTPRCPMQPMTNSAIGRNLRDRRVFRDSGSCPWRVISFEGSVHSTCYDDQIIICPEFLLLMREQTHNSTGTSHSLSLSRHRLRRFQAWDIRKKQSQHQLRFSQVLYPNRFTPALKWSPKMGNKTPACSLERRRLRSRWHRRLIAWSVYATRERCIANVEIERQSVFSESTS